MQVILYTYFTTAFGSICSWVEEFEGLVFVLDAIEETGAAFEVPIDGVDAAAFEESFSRFGLPFSAEILEFSVCFEIGVTVVFWGD